MNCFDGGCSTFYAWLFCKCMALFGKAEHRFPRIEDEYHDRFVEINDENKEVLEKLLQGEILFTPGHTKDSISLVKNNICFCGDAAMNGFPSMKRLTIWMEDKEEFEKSWDILIAENVEYIYPAHGKPFHKKDLCKFKSAIQKVKLYPLK